jgi:hypothetical protein
MMMRALSVLLLVAACGPNRTIPDRPDYQNPPPTMLTCEPNLDGMIEDAEAKAVIGNPESLLVSPAGVQRTVDQSGYVDGQGHRVWDFGADYADDQIAHLSAQPLSGHWFASSFPNGQYVVPVDVGGTVLGVYSDDGSNLYLHGIASAEEHPSNGQTLLPYQAPLALYQYPLTVGKTWVSAGEVKNGTLLGLPYAGRDTYEVKITQSGQLVLPDVTFTQTLLSLTTVTIEPAVGPNITRKQASWLFECFGEVARAASVNGETNDNFTTTSELRRLGLQ